MSQTLVDADIFATSRVPYQPEITQADIAQASEYRHDHEQRQSDERAARKRAQAETVKAMGDRMAQIFGSDIAFDLQMFKRSLRHRDALRQIEDGPLDHAEAAAGRAKEFADYLKERGINKTQFDQFTEGLTLVTPFPLVDFTGTVKPADHSDSKPAQPETTHFRPPFSDWQRGHDWGLLSGFHVAVKHLQNSAAGRVGHIITLDDSDATDLDVGSMEADTQIVFFYRVPRTGHVEVTVNATCERANHALRVDDEWGVSWSNVGQVASFMSHVVHPNVGTPTYSFLSELQHKKDTSTHRNEDRFWPGQQVQSSPMVSSGPVPAGTLVEIRAGLHSTDGALTNDMTVHSKSHHSWLISQIDVRMLP